MWDLMNLFWSFQVTNDCLQIQVFRSSKFKIQRTVQIFLISWVFVACGDDKDVNTVFVQTYRMWPWDNISELEYLRSIFNIAMTSFLEHFSDHLSKSRAEEEKINHRIIKFERKLGTFLVQPPPNSISSGDRWEKLLRALPSWVFKVLRTSKWPFHQK